MATPFVKWAGGKSKLAPIIEEKIESSIGFENISNYIEPFVGGGAFFFYLSNKYTFSEVTLMDINAELINAYRAIRDDVKEIINELDKLQTEYNSLEELDEKAQHFYQIREIFNSFHDKKRLEINVDFEQASRFIYLNKTCFNGLYRENSKGQYNVPFGKRDSINLYDLDNLLEISKILKNVNLVVGDYKQAEEYIEPLTPENLKDYQYTLVYFDPPYRPISGTASFNAYSKSGFNDNDQVELAKFCERISKKGAYVAISNSDPHNGAEKAKEDNFFDDLYGQKGPNFEIYRISAARAIAAKGTSRSKVSELLIVSDFTHIELLNQIDDVEDKEMPYDVPSYNEFIALNKDEKFNLLMNSLSPTNRTPDYYTNWEKVYRNISNIEVYLHTLTYLVGKDNIYEETFNLLSDNPKLVQAIPTLLAIRDNQFDILRLDENENLDFESINFADVDEHNIDLYVKFMNEAGLLDFLKSKASKSLVDYAYGIEVGLDSNGRKNRSGTYMELLVEKKIKKICEENGFEYLAQANANVIQGKWGIEVPFKESRRNHDFAIFIPQQNKLFLMEVNYYGGGGSKLKSVSGEFADFNAYLKEVAPNIEFLWITDGKGWLTAKKPLRDAFESMDFVINLAMLNNLFLDKHLSRDGQ